MKLGGVYGLLSYYYYYVLEGKELRKLTEEVVEQKSMVQKVEYS